MPSEATNAVLVARALRGNAAATEQLVRRHLRAAVAVALAVVGDPFEAEDVAHDAFVLAFQRLETCREPERFAGWLMQIVRHRALNTVLQGKARRASADALPAGEEPRAPEASRLALRQALAAGLDQLTDTQREVVLLHDLQGLTHAEIGAALQISEVMSRQHLFQARKALRAVLERADVTPAREQP
ncbi:MAG TPA: RNA polymerase sigma factor [Myxococcaceae bacterium]|nr:RNA polymerase sigma factor [Myxococcaceae bacterium]